MSKLSSQCRMQTFWYNSFCKLYGRFCRLQNIEKLKTADKSVGFIFFNGAKRVFYLQVPELGDTLFIVFRKQQLIFLHW